MKLVECRSDFTVFIACRQKLDAVDSSHRILGIQLQGHLFFGNIQKVRYFLWKEYESDEMCSHRWWKTSRKRYMPKRSRRRWSCRLLRPCIQTHWVTSSSRGTVPSTYMPSSYNIICIISEWVVCFFAAWAQESFQRQTLPGWLQTAVGLYREYGPSAVSVKKWYFSGKIRSYDLIALQNYCTFWSYLRASL